jgi:phosphoribosylformylglycinamidine synthase
VAERRNGDFVRAAIEAGRVAACHDVSGGGLLVALAAMAMAGGVGARLDLDAEAGLLFGEDQARYILVSSAPDALVASAAEAGVPLRRIGTTGGDRLALGGESVAVAALKAANESWLPGYMAGAD